ncbi:pimeloyl-ACP methyl ester carboxylesterase [Actinoplanes tereljensis]|uniref:Alpha/beta hydrolase n=1 Tax=Paractinoplanes tereljensis TaxID=571912 RepID=A0A919NJ61_9ACTN|nr:alpha/beta hydrolase [Actinoplanes tereljensis]GIF19660.1 alpha/beta hydrolase [Actinoplanes tereljensis]
MIRAQRNGSTPTVLLVHGAFTSSACWAAVIDAGRGFHLEMLAVPNPLRSLAGDAEYVAGMAGTHDGPVLLVGHGYGGAVITVAGTRAGNVVGLVYIAGFALAVGESCTDLLRQEPAAVAEALEPVDLPVGGRRSLEIQLRRESFAALYAADLPVAVAESAAASQYPIAAAAMEERPRSVAWSELPSWYLVATADRLLSPRSQRRMATRAGAVTAEVNASHAIVQSAPTAVAEFIQHAL